MKKNSAFPSEYLKKDDCGDGLTLTIENVVIETMPGDDKEQKPVVIFDRERPHPYKMVCNQINWELIVRATGEEDSDNWRGKRITLWADEQVEFGGKLVGGIRVRPKTVEPPTPEAVDEESIPFEAGVRK